VCEPALSATIPVVVEPVDDCAGFEVELARQLLDGFRGGVRLLLVGSLQSFLLFWSQNHTGFLEMGLLGLLLLLLLGEVLGAGALNEVTS